jgi:iron complex transport system substrate-binding protein
VKCEICVRDDGVVSSTAEIVARLAQTLAFSIAAKLNIVFLSILVNRNHLWLLVLLVTPTMLTCCGRVEPDALGESNQSPSLRIVSLSPAISRTLIDLELDTLLVGRTPFCDSVNRSIPIVGDLLDLNMEMLVRVRPTHVLIQPPASGIDPSLVRHAADRGWTIGAWHLDSINDVRTLISELPEVIASGDGALPFDWDKVAVRAAKLLQRVDDALTSKDDVFRGPVLLVFGLEPFTVFGRGTYLDEVLAVLGGTNVVTHRGYPQFSLEDLTRMKPEAVILVAPGADDGKSVRERLGAIARLEIPAVQSGRLAVLDHPDGFLPSSGLIGVAEAIREMLHAMQETDGSS